MKTVTPKKEPEIVREEVINHVQPEPVALNTNGETPAAKKEEKAVVTPEPVAVAEKKPVVKEPAVAAVEKKTVKEPVAVPPAPEKKTVAGSASMPQMSPSSSSRTATGAAWDFTSTPVTSTPLNLPPPEPVKVPSRISGDEFVPVNGPQAKAIKYTEKYGEAAAAEMEFRVQIAAVKTDNNAPLPNQKLLGKVERLNLNDGFTRITVGGSFKTLAEALAHNKKVVKAGQKEGFIIALYQGKRVSLDELEKMGLLK